MKVSCKFGMHQSLRKASQDHVFAYFQFDHFPQSKINFESRFEMRMSIFLFKIFLERFGQYFKKSKNGFPIVFQKCDLAGEGWGAKFINNNFF